jgi:hypothetical protein
MITIQFDAINGKAVPDGAIPLFVDCALETAKSFNPEQPELFLLVGNHMIIDEFRLRVVRDEIHHKNIQFKFVDANGDTHIIPCNQYGTLPNWPKGFCDQPIEILAEIGKKRRAERKQEAK